MTPDKLQKIQEAYAKQEADKQLQKQKQSEIGKEYRALNSNQAIKNAVNYSADKVSSTIKSHTPNVKVLNDNLASKDDIAGVVDSINKLNLTTLTASSPQIQQTADALEQFIEKVSALSSKLKDSQFEPVAQTLANLLEKIDDLPDRLNEIVIGVEKREQEERLLTEIKETLQGINFEPQINVEPAKVEVNKDTDLKPLIREVQTLQKAILNIEIPENKQTDIKPLIQAVNAVKKSIQDQVFPVPNYVLPFKDSNGNATQLEINDDGTIDVNAGNSSVSTGTYDSVSVGATATQVIALNSSRKSIMITNDTAGEIIYIGLDSGVSTLNGTPLEYHQSISFNDYSGEIYAISGSGSPVETRYIEVA